jgi:sucrose phosphorylase
MAVKVSSFTETEEEILTHLTFLYEEQEAVGCLAKIEELFVRYGFSLQTPLQSSSGWDETDAVLITYGDVIQNKSHPDVPRLRFLEWFLDEYLQDVISTVHILSFYPSSSDAGFSVMDYKQVREDLGDWNEIERLAEKYRLMADMVINHASRFGEWFSNYQKGEEPGKDYFIEAEPGEDLSATTRPRNSPLLTSVQTLNGVRYVWTTFSDDQIDLDFSNPDVLVEFIDIFLFYYSRGIRVFRLDAVAYLWKKRGTSCINLQETHQIVKLFRFLGECLDPEITLITETNVPFEQNVSYFSNGDEAQMIYQFSLPPLLLHAILTEQASYLTKWASGLPSPPEGCLYFNFTASHDGIGVRPLEGLVPQAEFQYLIKGTKERGGFISYSENTDNDNSDGQPIPYELNITYFDAFEEPGTPRTDLQIKRYMCSQIVALSLQGVPGIYFHNLTATKNNSQGVSKSGVKRDINRKQWDQQELKRCIENPDEAEYCPLEEYKELLAKRANHPAFHPQSPQKVVDINDQLFVLLRGEYEREKVVVISNFSSQETVIKAEKLQKIHLSGTTKQEIISGEKMNIKKGLKLQGFQTVWLIV